MSIWRFEPGWRIVALWVAIADDGTSGLDGSTFELTIVVDVFSMCVASSRSECFIGPRTSPLVAISGYAFSNFETPDADDEKHKI